MKTFPFSLILCLACFSVGFIHGCKKEANTPNNIPDGTPPGVGITTSFTEEFKDVAALTSSGTDWIVKNNSADSNDIYLTSWAQGQTGIDKSGNEYGFPAYSYSSDKDEYAFSGQSYASISSWLITPVLSVKNGDVISFYTTADQNSFNTNDRMQVLMNKSSSYDVGNSVDATGSFTATLFDINPNQAPGGYPDRWTKYEYTFTGISGKMNTRIAFRHYVTAPADNVRGVGIDLFKFEVK